LESLRSSRQLAPFASPLSPFATESFVKSIFSDHYHTTVGVRIHKRTVAVGGQTLDFIIWDLAGEDEFVALRTAYLRGASGYIVVADGTRPETLDNAIDLQRRAQAALGHVPFVLVVNKIDRVADWTMDENLLGELVKKGWLVFRTSAKTGQGVEDAFTRLAKALLCGETGDVASQAG
jgi:small GTP-binding protein